MRWALRILLLVILGLMTTVGVAWGLAWCFPNSDGILLAGSGTHAGEPEIQHYVARGVGWMVVRTDSTTRRWVFEDDHPPSWARGRHAEPTHEYTIHDTAYGLPLLALNHEGLPILENVRDGWAVGASDASNMTVLPLRPILPGFLVNTLFYAALWFGVFFGVAMLRRAIRRGRGRCVRCGYDLRGQRHQGTEALRDQGIRCPECGWGRMKST